MSRIAIIVAAASSLIIADSASAQYSPGQSFSTGGNQRQQTPAPQQYPMYNMQPAPQQQQAAPKTKQTTSAKRATSKPTEDATKTPRPKTVTKAAPAKKSDTAKSASTTEESYGMAAPHVSASTVSSSSSGSQVITAWPTGEKLICLTYDDGPDPFTPKLLAYLTENKVPATFYMLGERVKEYPHLVEQIVQQGYEIGNHTYDHKQLTKMSAEGIRQELQSTHDLMTSASHSAPIPTMRPPYGAQNATVRAVCSELGYKVVLWDIDTNDWRMRPAAQMINTIMKEAKDGSIILMHDRKHGGKETVMETTQAVVPALRERGFKFVTVSELLSHPRRSAGVSHDSGTSTTAATTPPGAQ